MIPRLCASSPFGSSLGWAQNTWSVQDQYKASVIYACKSLVTAGVYMHLDAGHAGWLGWPANISPAATLFTYIYTQSGGSNQPRPSHSPNPNYDETHHINVLGPMFTSAGWSAQFIVDQGRSGVQNILSAWGNWCNIKGAGFGPHPTPSTGDSRVDAIVWVKPGGEYDGTSNTSTTRYDPMCGGANAKVPAPEAGQWFQAYFVNNANPAL